MNSVLMCVCIRHTAANTGARGYTLTCYNESTITTLSSLQAYRRDVRGQINNIVIAL